FNELFDFTIQESEADEPAGHDGDAAGVNRVERDPDTRRLDGVELRLEHELVDGLLGSREGFSDRKGPGHVARVVPELAARIDEEQVARLDLPIVLPVVEDARVGPRADHAAGGRA